MALSGEMEGSVSGLQYHYKLGFAEEPLTVEKLVGNLSLPGWTRTGILRKEEKIKMQDLSEFLVSYLEYDSQKNIRLIIENKKANRKFRIEGGGRRYFVYEDDKEITADKELGLLLIWKAWQKFRKKFRIISGQISALIHFQKSCLMRRMQSPQTRSLTA